MFEQDLDLPALPAGADLVPLNHLYLSLKKVFGDDSWLRYEPETIQLHLGVTMSALAVDKLNVVKVALLDPSVQDNASFIMHACSVVNNEVADFETMPYHTSLELAFYVKSMQNLMVAAGKSFLPTDALKAITKHILVEEGYSKALAPFLYLEDGDLNPGQTATDTASKGQAIEQYIEHMESV